MMAFHSVVSAHSSGAVDSPVPSWTVGASTSYIRHNIRAPARVEGNIAHMLKHSKDSFTAHSLAQQVHDELAKNMTYPRAHLI